MSSSVNQDSDLEHLAVLQQHDLPGPQYGAHIQLCTIAPFQGSHQVLELSETLMISALGNFSCSLAMPANVSTRGVQSSLGTSPLLFYVHLFRICLVGGLAQLPMIRRFPGQSSPQCWPSRSPSQHHRPSCRP